MANLFDTYFTGVRWVELALAFGVAVLGDLQLTLQSGGRIDQQSLLKSLGLGLGVAWAYLRMPKDLGAVQDVFVDGELPAGADATGPADDVAEDRVVQVVASALPPMVAAAAPELAGNIVREVGRVLRRGIRF